MTNLWDDIKAKLQSFAGSWASYATLGSFALYVLGYLALRFHLTVLGIGTDLRVLDERYLFTGAKFVVYLVSSIPSVILVVMLLAIVLGVLYLIYALIAKSSTKVKNAGRSIGKLVSGPVFLALTGIVLSVSLIQFVMRQCYFFSNLLLAKSISHANFDLESLLIGGAKIGPGPFFSCLVAGTLTTATLLVCARAQTTLSRAAKILIALLIFLVAVQFLLLPVNYGVFIMDKEMAKVKDLGDEKPLPDGTDAWLVWEGTDGVTFLVQNSSKNEQTGKVEIKRSLVTLPQKDVKRTEIVGYDPVLTRIFNSP